MNNNILNELEHLRELEKLLKSQGISKINHRSILDNNWYRYEDIAKEIENDYMLLLDSFCTVEFGKDYRVHWIYNAIYNELNQIKNKHKLEALKWAQAECLKLSKR